MPDSTDVTLLYLIKQVELAVRSRLEDVVSSYGVDVSAVHSAYGLGTPPGAHLR